MHRQTLPRGSGGAFFWWLLNFVFFLSDQLFKRLWPAFLYILKFQPFYPRPPGEMKNRTTAVPRSPFVRFAQKSGIIL